MKRITRRFLAMLLASLMMVSALPVYAAGEEAPAQDDPWMDYAQEHLRSEERRVGKECL